jgi:diguanylate cyclase (GGDEF)-like protein
MIDRRQKKRILIFLLALVLAIILFITNDTAVRVIAIALMVIYIGFLIFLRDSLKFKSEFETSYPPVDEDEGNETGPAVNVDESFEIISQNKSTEIITAEDFRPNRSVPKTTLIPPDLKERFEEIVNEKFPSEFGHDGQFTFVLEKMLTVIKEAYNAHTAIFFWYNKNKEKLSVEKYISSSEEVSDRKFDIEDDILSKIVQNGEPELLTDISPAAEADVIRYYSSVQGIRSFVGVPLFYNKQLIAVLAVDSKAGDVFGIETIYSLGRFVRVITMIIAIFDEKHSDSLTQQRLNGILNLINPENKFDSELDISLSLQNSIGYLINWDVFSFIYYEPLLHKFKTARIINNTSLKYAGEGLIVDIAGTLVGKSITTGVPLKIDDTSSGEYKRFSKSEDINFEGSFLAIPVVYGKQNYGVLCFESLKKNAYSNADIQFMKSAINIIAFIIFSYSTQSLLKNFISVDLETKALNTDAFKDRLSADLLKAQQFKAPSALALIKIDDFLEQESLFEVDTLPRVLSSICETINHELTPFNLFGRLGEKVLAVYFFNSTSKDVFIWAEKLRVKIARKPIAVVSKQTTYTVSIGVAAASNKLEPDELIYNADLALQKALEKGGNTVRNIN